MKTIQYISIFMLTGILFGCQKDPLSEINDGSWNKERNIINISFAGQVGVPTIVRNGDAATIEFLSYSDDFSSIEVKSMELSYGATASKGPGEKLDFSNPEKTAVITITPVNGEPLNWTIKASKFINPYTGTWGIQNFKFIWDDGNGWGLSGEADVAAKMTSAAPGLDDLITFGTIEGVDLSGSLYGSYERVSGPDGAFGSYISPAGTDWSYKFGQLPGGKGKYFINADNSITVEIGENGKKITSKGSKTTDGQTMTYELNAQQLFTIDWNDYYSIENQLKTGKEIWYVLKKI